MTKQKTMDVIKWELLQKKETGAFFSEKLQSLMHSLYFGFHPKEALLTKDDIPLLEGIKIGLQEADQSFNISEINRLIEYLNDDFDIRLRRKTCVMPLYNVGINVFCIQHEVSSPRCMFAEIIGRELTESNEWSYEIIRADADFAYPPIIVAESELYFDFKEVIALLHEEMLSKQNEISGHHLNEVNRLLKEQ